MKRNTIIRLGTTALATGVAGLALAAPANAVLAPDPDVGSIVNSPGPGTTPSSDDPWMEIAVGALGGLALAGAGIAAAAGVRHRQAVSTT